MTRFQRGYPLDMLSPVRYVVTAMEDAAREGRILQWSDLLHGYSHPMSADEVRVSRNEHTTVPKAKILGWALTELGNQVSFNKVRGYLLTVPFEDVRYEGSPVYRFTGDDPRIEEQRQRDREIIPSPGTARPMSDDEVWEYVSKHWRKMGGKQSIPDIAIAIGWADRSLRRLVEKHNGHARKIKMDRTALYVLRQHFEPAEVAQEIAARKDGDLVYSFLMDVLEVLAPMLVAGKQQGTTE